MTCKKWLMLFAAMPLMVFSGCGGGDSRGRNDMVEVGLAYHTYFNDQKKGPKDATELAMHVTPSVSKQRGEGKFVIIPNVDLLEYKDKSDVVIAYQKDVPTQGGWVAMTDGSVRKMSADEFSKANKATSKQ